MLYKNKHRIESIRLRHWDYRSAGWYFVTICTKQRISWFGSIQNESMHRSDIGDIINDEWFKTQHIRSYVTLDAFVVMPDHLHGIIQIVSNGWGQTPQRGVSTRITTHSHWQSHSLGTIINQFKSICTKRIWALGYPSFKWQPRFYDRIIRTEQELYNVQQYIHNNPKNWAK